MAAYHNVINTLPQQTTTDAEFRAFGSTINAQLAAMGLIQTADTGQINWVTVAKPAGANGNAGYEIWRFADALQATSPIFIKLEYGTGGISTCPGIWVTVGRASSGAGALVGTTTTRTACATQGTSALIHLHLFSGDTDRFVIVWGFDASDNGTPTRCIFISVEREVDANGARVGTGVYVTLSGTSSSPAVQEYFSQLTGGVGQESNLGIHVPRLGNGTNGSVVGIFPQYHVNNVFRPCGLNQFAYFNTAIPKNVTIAFDVYGITHTYYPLGAGAFTTQVNRAGATGVTLMVRYD